MNQEIKIAVCDDLAEDRENITHCFRNTQTKITYM